MLFRLSSLITTFDFRQYGKRKAISEFNLFFTKVPGKGGWTYAEIPEILQNRNNPFGWVKIKGTIDGFELKQHKLMPMGNGKLFLPVKAEIRKKIKKEAGDFVDVILFADETQLEIPNEIIECFQNEPEKLYKTFLSFTEGEQKSYLDWIYSAKTEDTKASRIVTMMVRLQKKMKFFMTKNRIIYWVIVKIAISAT